MVELGDDMSGGDRADPVRAFSERQKIMQIARELGVARDTQGPAVRSDGVQLHAHGPATAQAGPWGG